MEKNPNRFGSLLDRFFTQRQLTLRRAAAILDQHHTTLSLVTRGMQLLSKRDLEILLGHIINQASALELPQAEAVEFTVTLHAAWLEDHVLPAYQESVAVIRKGRPLSNEPTDPRSRAIAFFDALSRRDPSVADWLVATHAVMEQTTPSQATAGPKRNAKTTPTRGRNQAADSATKRPLRSKIS